MLTVVRPVNCCVRWRGIGRTQWPDRDPLCEQHEDLRGLPAKGPCLSQGFSTDYRPREHEDVLERHRARMQGAGDLMRRRSAIVEHPFGTLKCRAGYRHFLVRGFNKVRGEWSLMALCYNFTRVLNILGFERFVAFMAKALRALSRALKAAQAAYSSFGSVLDKREGRAPDQTFRPLPRRMTNTTCSPRRANQPH